jgi:DNA binding domain, excisionase family
MANGRSTMTVKEMAQYLGIGYNKAYDLVRKGGLPALKIGRQYRIPKAALDQWIEKTVESREIVGL